MQKGIVLSQAEIKKIIAEHFHVSEDKVIASKKTAKKMTITTGA